MNRLDSTKGCTEQNRTSVQGNDEREGSVQHGGSSEDEEEEDEDEDPSLALINKIKSWIKEMEAYRDDLQRISVRELSKRY